jgi:hypothetical protein
MRSHRLLRQLSPPACDQHFLATGHSIIRSFELGETWFWNFETESEARDEALAPSESHPEDQPAPGPDGFPQNGQSLLNE